MSQYYPPVVFHFTVSFADGNIPDFVCQEVNGLDAGQDVADIREGGENRFVHQIPKCVKQGNLILKGGISSASSPLISWCKSTIESGLSEPVKPRDLTVSLLDESGDAGIRWQVTRAFPVKWAIGNFDAMKNEITVDAIELACSTITRDL